MAKFKKSKLAERIIKENSDYKGAAISSPDEDRLAKELSDVGISPEDIGNFLDGLSELGC